MHATSVRASSRRRSRGAGVVVDAVFGTGFAGRPADPAVSAIEAINEAGAPVVATDIASGVNASTRRGGGQGRRTPTSR